MTKTEKRMLRTPAVKILIFGYKEFSQLMGSVLPEFSELAEFKVVDAILGSLSEIEAHITEFQPDAVISAGSNAAYLKSALKRPVLTLDVTESDVIQAVSKAAKISKQILLISFNSPGIVLPLLEKSLDIAIDYRAYETPNAAREEYHLASKTKQTAVVGASLVCGLASEDGLPAFLFYSPDSCRRTIVNAIQQARQHRSSSEAKALTEWLMRDSQTPLVIIEQSTQVVTYNRSATQSFDLNSESKFEIKELFNEHQRNQGHVTINGKEWLYHRFEEAVSGKHYTIYQLQHNVISNTHSAPATHQIVYRSQALAEILQQAALYASSPSNVLIYGETGTGKELVARSVYQQSPFNKGKFIALNCSAIPSELFEGELFGYQDGAFTGSRRGGRKGLIQEAEGGVLFLDEISELAFDQQAKLLRFLQERAVRRLGSNRETPIELKIIAASNKPLRELVEKGDFREDLYFRLNVFNISIPPLRERRDDVLIIAQEKLKQYLKLHNYEFNAEQVLTHINQLLCEYEWPGNVRELENVLERLVASLISVSEQSEIQQLLRKIAPELNKHHNNKTNGVLQQNEVQLLQDAMSRFNGNKTKVAEYLGISQTTVWRRLKTIDNHRGEII